MSSDLAIDLGSAVTRVADAAGDVVLEEPTVAAVDADTRRLVGFGSEAYERAASTAGRVAALRPVHRGQLVDLDLTDALLAEVLRRAGAGRLSRPRVVACVSSAATPVQLRAVERSLRHAGARAVRLVEAPLACALGAGLPVGEPSGWMVLDVGAGTTEAAVLALGGVVSATVAGVGGDDLDEALHHHLVQHFDVHLDRRTLEWVRRELGSVAAGAPDLELEVVARDRASGEACLVRLTRSELRPLLERVLRPILDAAVATITKSPPELANDLIGNGIQLAGGVALLDGLDRRLASATGLPVHVEDPQRLAVCGAAASLAELGDDRPLSASRR